MLLLWWCKRFNFDLMILPLLTGGGGHWGALCRPRWYRIITWLFIIWWFSRRLFNFITIWCLVVLICLSDILGVLLKLLLLESSALWILQIRSLLSIDLEWPRRCGQQWIPTVSAFSELLNYFREFRIELSIGIPQLEQWLSCQLSLGDVHWPL